MTPQHQHQSTESKWQGLYKVGGIATTVMLALIPIQIMIYITNGASTLDFRVEHSIEP